MTQSTAPVLRIDIYSDVACPWCWIGGHRLAAAISQLGGDITVEEVHHPFQLAPEASEQPQPLSQLLSKKFGADSAARMIVQMTAVGRQEGVTFNFESALGVNTFKAHQMLWLAGREHSHAVQSSLLGLLFEAYFQKGLDVANTDVLVGLAVQAGMDGARARQVLQTGEGRDEVLAELKATRARGVNSVPTLAFPNGDSISGALDVPSLVDLLRRQIANMSGASG